MGLDTVEFVLWTENEFGIEIPDNEASKLETVGSLCRYIEQRLAEKPSSYSHGYEGIYERVANQLETEYGVSKHLINEQARFVKDLGLD